MINRRVGIIDGVRITFSSPKGTTPRDPINPRRDDGPLSTVPANILVAGIPSHLSNEVIELFFENESKSIKGEFGKVLGVKQTQYGHIVRFSDDKGKYSNNITIP